MPIYRWTDGNLLRRARFGNALAGAAACCCDGEQCPCNAAQWRVEVLDVDNWPVLVKPCNDCDDLEGTYVLDRYLGSDFPTGEFCVQEVTGADNVCYYKLDITGACSAESIWLSAATTAGITNIIVSFVFPDRDCVAVGGSAAEDECEDILLGTDLGVFTGDPADPPCDAISDGIRVTALEA